MATILIVDSRPSDRQIFVTLLGSFGHRMIEAGDGSQALELAKAELPDLIITDIVMPNMDGFTLVRRLRAEPLLAGVPVVFQTAHYLESEIHKLATASGIEHILGKPSEPQEILRAVQDSLQHPTKHSRLPQTGQLHREHLQLLADKLYQKNIELEKANERLRNLSLTDELTGLNNRRGFAILANGLFKFARRANHALCLLYIDMDSLKHVNNAFGHAEGDTALNHFARILTETFRDSDVIARMGGDEFAVLTIDATENNIAVIQARLQSNVDAYNLVSVRGYPLSFSLGIIQINLDSIFSVDALLAQADTAMYEHKQTKKGKA
ncbi:MAG TPA: diguanylate cyclase [Anaerolineales bacterium]|jgi:diguanylate cyclase (GGDEF)-like protein|nr:diguanylate cyclase [Anaerolineales bacterium]